MTRKLLLATTLLSSVSIAATATARPMTPEDVAKLESVGAMNISPDGSRIVYTTASLPDVSEGADNGSTKQQLKLAYGPDQARDFLPADMSVRGVNFTPDGAMVSFLWSAEDEKRAVWGIPVDGGGHRKLAEVDGANVLSYEFSPDSQTVYMLAAPMNDKQRETQNKAGFNAVVYEEESEFNRLFSAKIGMAVDTDPQELTVPGYVSAIRITPDGSKAVIDSAPSPAVDDSYTSKRVHVMDLASGQVTAVIKTPGKLGDVEINPAGDRISMIAAVDANDPAATTLYFAELATGEFTPVNEGAAEAMVDTEWLSDGRLAAVIHTGASSSLRLYNPDGTVSSETDGGNLILTNVESANGKIAVEAHSAQHPPEVWSWDGGAFTRWTRHNPWLADIDMGTQRTFTYTARDGQEIEGVLIEPVGGAPKGGAPTIFDVHGGPEAHESNGWVTNYGSPGQVAAGQGYAVFLPNYRGSTAYGTAFSKQHQGDYAGKEFDDLVDGKRALVAAGITDTDRTGITGGSYGGFASAWGATRYSQEYAASVMFVGISNNISKFGTTDIPNEMYLVHELKWPWDEWQRLLERSPIYHAGNAETPLLIMHGAEDTRVSPTQSYELYRNIKVRKPDTPLRLVLYPGEGHGNQRAAARYDYNLRMMEWFDTYLKTGDRKAELPAPRPQLADGAKGAKAKKTDEAE
jgi:dipeptidyl aminopeptidase/acylaminoacyl peptidase